MPWALTMSGEGSPQAKSPLMQGDPDKDGPGEKLDSLGPGSVSIDMQDGATSSTKRRPPSWRLRYQDFTISRPSQNSSRQSEEGPRGFQSLVDRANDWLLKATDSKILTCETLQWTSTKAHQLDDSEQMMMSRAASDGSNTYYKRGLRLWLTPRTTNSRQPQVLAYTDYAPETNDVLTNVINRANKAATTDGIEGKIITIETVQAPILNGNVDSTGLWWSEKASEDYPWAMVLRTFYIKDTRTKETIGIKDFVPQQSSDGFEPFSQLIEKANKWLKDQSDIRVTNMQSIILPKRDTPLSEISSVCFIVVPGVHSSTKQEYLRILRVTYTNPAEDALSELPLVYPFYFETFTPEIVTPKDNKKKERIERMKETFSRVATFLKNTELDVICVEVVPNPIHIPEVDSLNADDDKQQMRFLCTLRLYLNGQVNIDNVARSLLAAVSTSHVQPTHPSGNAAAAAAAAAATQQSPLLPHQQSIQQSHYHVPIPNTGHTNNSKFIASKSIRDKSRTRIDSLDTSHPGPIFLRHVTVGPRRNRMIIAFITVFVAISIIVVLSVFYTNQLDT